MAKDKEQRPATARELADSLATFTGTCSVQPSVAGAWAAPPEPAKIKEPLSTAKPKLA